MKWECEKVTASPWYLPNSVQFIISWLGIQRIGAVPVPISPIYTAFDLKYMANDTGAKIVICFDRNYGYVKQALPETQLEHVIFTGLIELLPWWKKTFDFFADKAPKGKVEKSPHISSMKDVIKRGVQSLRPSLIYVIGILRKSCILEELQNIPKVFQ